MGRVGEGLAGKTLGHVGPNWGGEVGAVAAYQTQSHSCLCLPVSLHCCLTRARVQMWTILKCNPGLTAIGWELNKFGTLLGQALYTYTDVDPG